MDFTTLSHLRVNMYEMKFKLTVLASGYSKLFTTHEAAERFAVMILGLESVAYTVEPIVSP
jgi:hypothetical protein